MKAPEYLPKAAKARKPSAKAKAKSPAKELDHLFDPRSIVLVGASHSGLKLGGVVLKNILRLRPRVRIFPVNPKFNRLMGARAYSTAGDIWNRRGRGGLKGKADLAIIIRPAREVPDILRELKGRVHCTIVVSAGFAESGKTELQNEVRRIAREGGIRLAGPNCMGVSNSSNGLDTFILPEERFRRPRPGSVAIVTQSGAVLSLLCEAFSLSGPEMGSSITAHYGNAADIDESDIFEYLETHEKTKAVICYIESVRDGRRFIRRTRRLARKKPLLVLKAGKGTAGQAAAFSHTGRLAGSYEVFKSVLAQFSLPEAADFEDLVDGAKALALQRPVKGNRVLILTNGGGAGVLASDECSRQGFSEAQIRPRKLARLKKIFPSFYMSGNPFDLTAQVTDGDYRSVLEELKDDYDGFIVIALSAVKGITEGLGRILADFRRRSGKPMVFHTGRDAVGKKLALMAGQAGIPAFDSPERAVRALRKLLIK